jgi:anti-anti-sigma factor
MEIHQSHVNGVCVVAMKGRVDASNAGDLEKKVLALVDCGERRLVFDFAELDYMSSAGLRVLLLAAKRLAGVNGKIALAALQKPVKEVLDMTGFSSIIQIFSTQKDAVAAVR